MKVGVARETAAGERRVALVPEALGKLTAAGLEVLVETGAGSGAAIPDSAYAEAGATVVPTGELYAQADVILRVQKPSEAEVARLRSGQVVVGFLAPLIDPQLAASLAAKGITAISLDALPRTLSRAQSMDALSSQANVGGYKAVLIAANAYGRYFPLLTTAAGTARPANVLILGIGVAGLQAIGTARRLGAVVKAYDVRSETKEQAESLGATFIVLKSVADASGEGGYARQLTPEEQAAQQAELNGHIATMDIVITTAQVPGRRPPLLVTAGGRGRDEARLGHRRHGRVGARRQRRAVEGRRDDRDRQRGHDHRAGQPAGHDAGGSLGLLRPEHLGAAPPLRQGRRDDLRLRGGDHCGDRHHPRRPGRPGGHEEAARARGACRARRRCHVSPELLNSLAIFVLAILVGFEVISKVPATLHTPLMSGANSIHGIVLVGAMFIAAEADNPVSYLLAFIAMVFGAMNVVGGYVVTDRMLQMFRKKPTAAKAAGSEGASSASGS